MSSYRKIKWKGIRGSTGGLFAPRSYREFFVDATNGNDANPGTSRAQAWQTLDPKVNGETFRPTDHILLQGLFREQLTLPSSGIPGKPITFGVYGSGAIINGADLVTGWGLYGGSTYSVVWGSGDVVVIEDGTILTIGADEDSLTSGQWFQTGGNLYVRATNDADPDTHTMEVANRSYSINGNGQDHIAIRGIELRYCKYQAIYLNAATNWLINSVTSKAPGANHLQTVTGVCNDLTMRGCTLSDAGEESLYLGVGLHTSGSLILENNTIAVTDWKLNQEQDAVDVKENNTASILVDGNIITVDKGVSPTTSAYGIITLSAATIQNNVVNDPVRAGVRVALHNGSVVRYNRVNQTRAGSARPLHGVSFNGDDHQIYYNVCVMTGDTSNDCHGLHGDYAAAHDGVNCYNNVLYGWKRGFYSDDALTAFNMKNNIFAEYTILGIFLGNPAGLICDYNCVYTTQGGTNYGRFNGANKAALANWQADTTYGDNSTESDPAFVGEPGDLTIGVGSSCRNAGDDVSLTPDYAGVTVPQETNPAIGAYEYAA